MNTADRLIELVGINPAEFFGVNDANLRYLKTFFPKLKIIARGNTILLNGDEEVMDEFERKCELLVAHFNKFNFLSENSIDNLMLSDGSKLLSNDDGSETLVHGNGGVKIKARTVNQKKLVQEINVKDMVFAIGPAGTGKTYTAVAMAVRALKAKEVKRIVLTRPAVEAGENLGFLPGDMKDKIDPYLIPLYDSLYELLGYEKIQRKIEEGIIEIAPLAFMRGRTLKDSFVILDEAQNATFTQIKMFLTRLGNNSTMVINGDPSQVDLAKSKESGLYETTKILKDIKEIKTINFDHNDVMRHPLVSKIVKAYDDYKKKEPNGKS